jgi:hypothetical protein
LTEDPVLEALSPNVHVYEGAPEHEGADEAPTNASATPAMPVGGASAEQVSEQGAGGAASRTLMVKVLDVFDPLALVAIRLTK